MILPAIPRNLTEIATLHIESFQDHFLPKLGVTLLEKYYMEFLTEDNIFLVNVNKYNEIDGFLLGTPSSSVGRNKFMINNKIRLALRIMWLCIKGDKNTWSRVFGLIKSSFLKKNSEAQQKAKKSGINGPSILSICVSKKVQGNGVAKALVEEFEKRLLESGFQGYTLTVHKTNNRAIHFYEKIGMTVYKETSSEYRYQKNLIDSRT